MPRKVTPCLADLLRTCVHPPALLLQVEHVLCSDEHSYDRGHVTAEEDESRQDNEDESGQSIPLYVRLALSDGELQIQALLATNLQTKELLEVRRGDLLEVKEFRVRKAPRVTGHGSVVYLGIEACQWAGTTAEIADEELAGGFFVEQGLIEASGEDPLPTSSTIPRIARWGSSTEEEHNTEEATTPTTHLSDSKPSDVFRIGRKRSRERQDVADKLSKREPCETKQIPSKVRATPTRRLKVRFAGLTDDEAHGSDDDDFETIAISPSTIQKRREVLHYVSQNAPSRLVAAPKSFQLFDGKGAGDDAGESPPISPEKQTARRRQNERERGVGSPSGSNINSQPGIQATEPQSPVSLTAGKHPPCPPDSSHPETQFPGSSTSLLNPPIHTLATLLHSPTLPRRNYTCSVFGVVTWLSPALTHKPNSPFPPKRHVKIHDPSISARRVGVTLAVYVDAREFMPVVGTIALFRGVTMQRWEGEVILNAYASLKDGGQEWFVCDEGRLQEMGFDVTGLRKWWVARQEKQAASSSKG